MNNFSYARTEDVAAALKEKTAGTGTRFIAGGTNLLDLMKVQVEQPSHLVDIRHLPL
jgi:xanthine dehydrogenase YagS FAD-binding subunit